MCLMNPDIVGDEIYIGFLFYLNRLDRVLNSSLPSTCRPFHLSRRFVSIASCLIAIF